MKTYKHKITGNIATQLLNDGLYKIDFRETWLPKWIVENSNDWQEVIEIPVGTKVVDTNPETEGYTYTKQPTGKWKLHEMDYFTISESSIGENKRFRIVEDKKENIHNYEIEEFSYCEWKSNAKWNEANRRYELISNSDVYWNLDCLLNVGHSVKSGHIKIHSVKRLSDNKIFTIGDNVTLFEWNVKNCFINAFHIHKETQQLGIEIRQEDTTSIYYNGFDTLKQVEKPLFTTEDGVNIYRLDKYHAVNKKCNTLSTNLTAYGEIAKDYENNAFIYYFSEEKAKEYILMNKPCLSITEVLDLLEGDNTNLCKATYWKYNKTNKESLEVFKELVKKK